MTAAAHGAHHLQGMGYAVAGYGLVTFFDGLLKFVSRAGYPQWQMMATVGVFGAVTVLVMALLTGGIRKRLGTRKPGFHILRGMLGLIGFFSGFYAIRHIPLVDFYGIIFTQPLIIAILSVMWLKEPVGWARWSAIGLGFIGVSLMLRAGMQQAPSAGAMLGYAGALGCALFNAVSTLMVRRYGRSESNLTFSFYSALCNVAVTAALLSLLGGVAYAWQDFALLTLAGILVGSASVLLLTAYQLAPPAAIAPFQYSQLVWGGALGYVVFGDVPGAMMLAGAAIVIVSGWFVAWREARLARALRKAAKVLQQGL